MDISDVGACAMLTIDRFLEAHGVRPAVLYLGPVEYGLLVQEFGLEGLNFYGIPVRSMETDGVMARDEVLPD